jgi:glyoxylase-like metal-dependent hydrolase (beta-lactamase superfamily II)
MDDYVSAFMVTPEGIILVEPIGTEFATWLKGELAQRFHVPVKYVIYSHFHWDHASGGDVYADTARFIGHENMIKNVAMPPANTPLPQNVRAQDTNGNGRIEQDEAKGNLKTMFSLYDANKDGSLSGAEVTRGPLEFVRAPDLTYTDRININLGGKRVEVISRPIPHADDNTIVRFVDGTNVLFASDWITIHRLPFGPIRPDEIDMIKAVEAMDFEYFVCSHGKLGKKADVALNIRYREGAQGRRCQGDCRRPDPGAGAIERPDGELQGLGILRPAARAERRRHLSGAQGELTGPLNQEDFRWSSPNF